MNRNALIVLFSLVAAQASASQFDTLHQIEVQQQQADDQQRAEYDRQAAAAQAQAQAQEDAYERNQLAAQRKANAQALADRKAREQEVARQRTRAEQAEDQDHELDVEERKLKLQALKAKVDRSNEYIDADLHNSAAQTDVIQSKADATRDLSSGSKSLLEDTGKADVNRSNKLFGN